MLFALVIYPPINQGHDTSLQVQDAEGWEYDFDVQQLSDEVRLLKDDLEKAEEYCRIMEDDKLAAEERCREAEAKVYFCLSCVGGRQTSYHSMCNEADKI